MRTSNGQEETDRVRAHTAPESNDRIDEKIRERLLYYAARREKIPGRIQELDREWDVERWLEMNASSLALTGLVLGLTANKKWFLAPGVILSFLLLHAVQGWCPPLPVMRRLGVRTQREIDEEKYALKFLQGDYAALKAAIEDAQRAIETFKAGVS